MTENSQTRSPLIVFLYAPPPWEVMGRIQKLAFHLAREKSVLYFYVRSWKTLLSPPGAQQTPWTPPAEAKLLKIIPTPFFLPLGSLLGIRHINGWRVARKIRSILARRGIRSQDVLFVVTDPAAAEVLRLFPHCPILYDCSDDFDEWHFLPKRVLEIRKKNEKWIAREAKAITVTSDRLREKMLKLNQRVIQIGNGVDFELFAAPEQTEPPAELQKLPHPIIGFTGAAEGYVDIPLVRAIARKHRACSFVFIGPLKRVEEQLHDEPNILFLGFKPYEQLPRYVTNCDVCFIPANKKPASLSAEPSKLYQYLAAGKPVLCTDLPELVKHSPYVYLFRDANDFPNALEKALNEPRQETQKRRDYASHFDWSRRASEFTRLIDQLLGGSSVSGNI